MASTLSLLLASDLTSFFSLTTALPQRDIRATPPPVRLLAGDSTTHRLRFALLLIPIP